MKMIKTIATVTYFLSWGLCLLPNASNTGATYDEPQDDKVLNKIIELPAKDHETTCDGYTIDTTTKIKLEDLLQHEGTFDVLDDANVSYNPDDYDSGDYQR